MALMTRHGKLRGYWDVHRELAHVALRVMPA